MPPMNHNRFRCCTATSHPAPAAASSNTMAKTLSRTSGGRSVTRLLIWESEGLVTILLLQMNLELGDKLLASETPRGGVFQDSGGEITKRLMADALMRMG